MIFDLAEFCRDYICPSTNHNVNGPKGTGKTHLAIALAENVLAGRLPCGTKHVQVMTNVAMEQRVAENGDDGDFVDAYPPGVRPFKTFIELLEGAGRTLKRYGMGNVTIIVILDEAQNYMLSDQNSRAENLALVKFMGNTRKFGICTFFMTPSRRNLVPRIRGFEDSLDAGYCTVEWQKNRRLAAEYLRRFPSVKANPRDIVMIRTSDEEELLPIWVPPSTWTRPPESIGVGEHVYQTLAAADFSMGSNANGVEFDIDDFLRFISGNNFRRTPQLICEYFEEFHTRYKVDRHGNRIEPGGTAPSKADAFLQRHSAQCEAIGRMREAGDTWRKIAHVFQEDEGTLRSRCRKFFEMFPERDVSRKTEGASKGVKGEHHGSGTAVYIEPKLKEGASDGPALTEEGTC